MGGSGGVIGVGASEEDVPVEVTVLVVRLRRRDSRDVIVVLKSRSATDDR